MTLTRTAVALVLVGLAFLLLPDTAFAWTPGTHIWLSETILANLHLLPPKAADLLHAFPAPSPIRASGSTAGRMGRFSSTGCSAAC